MKISENKSLSSLSPPTQLTRTQKFLFGWAGVIVAIATLGQLQRWQLTPSLAFYLQDILIVGWLAAWWWLIGRHLPWLAVSNWKNLFRQSWFITGLWIVLGWILAMITTANWFELIRPILYLVRLLAVWAFAQALAAAWPPSEKWLAKFGLGIAGGLVLLWGLLQYIWLPDTRFLKTFGWDDHYYRLIGTLFDPGFTGLLLTMTGFGWVSWQAPKVWRWANQTRWWWLAVGSIILTCGVLLTYSRASYLSLAISMAWLAWRSWQQHQLRILLASALVVACLVSGMPFLPRPTGEGVQLERSSTVFSRIDTNRLALRQLEPIEWWLGRGLFVSKPNPVSAENSSALPDHAQLPDNILVLFLTGVGIGGCLVGLKLFAPTVWRWWLAQPAWLQSLWLAVILHSLFNNSLFQPQIWLFLQLWTAFGAIPIKAKT